MAKFNEVTHALPLRLSGDASVRKTRLSARLRKRWSFKLVMAKYNENISWTNMYAGVRVIYDKGSESATTQQGQVGYDDEVVKQIKQLLDTRVRPAVAMDGGDIVFQGFDDGIVTLQMRGACQGCPSSPATLKMSIENMLRHYIPDVREVRAADF